MPHPVEIPEDTGLGYLIILLFTLLGTLARVFQNWMSGKPISILFTIGQIIISIFASSIMLMLAIRLGWQIYGVSIACGLSAWMGIKILTIFEKMFTDRIERKSDENKR
ncbi:hypothetical protein [Dryocola sp. LX212]